MLAAIYSSPIQSRDLINRYGFKNVKPGRTDIVRHKIGKHLDDFPESRRKRQEFLQKIIRDEVVEPATNPWASPVVLVKK